MFSREEVEQTPTSVYALNVYDRNDHIRKTLLFATKVAAQRSMAKRVKQMADRFLQEYDKPENVEKWKKLMDGELGIYEERRQTCVQALQLLQREELEKLSNHHLLGPGYRHYVRYEIVKRVVFRDMER